MPALGLGDDAAVFSPPPDKELVITKDALVAGIHFFEDDAADLVARKAVRVNLSDLAAMGATPYGYLISLAIPKHMQDIDGWVSLFSQGLALEQENHGWSLFGGDTVSTTGPLCISLTALGTVNKGQALRRNGAKVGDQVYVSGTLGDSALGLAFLKGDLEGEGGDELVKRYHMPEPRLAFGQQLFGIAGAVMDISDGLGGDMGHICAQSGLGAKIFRSLLPLSSPAGKVLERSPSYKELIWQGGDDYELLFTVPEHKEDALKILADELDLRVTKIGHMTGGKDLQIMDDEGNNLMGEHTGYRHF